MKIIRLTMEHGEALQRFLSEFAKVGEEMIPAYGPPRDWGHGQIVDTLAAWSRGERLQEGWVPGTTLFLEEGGELLGIVNLRHKLTEALKRYGGHMGYSVRPSSRRQGYGTLLLEAGMVEARSLGIERLLVTCEPTNLGSIRVIENNGGVLQDEFFHEGVQRLVRCYWIDL